MTADLKLHICKLTREVAAKTLESTLHSVLASKNPVSEFEFRDLWLFNLRKHTEVFPDGWYAPPPQGIGVLFSTESDFSRINYKSLRPQKRWPREDVFLNRKTGFAYFYASPVDRTSGILGDFGMTIYFGKNEKIKTHLKNCLHINQVLFEFVKVGMSFAELTRYANELFSKNNFSNDIESTTDPAKVNLGHTVPGIQNEWSKAELTLLLEADPKKIADLISSNRIFVSSEENFTIRPGMAFTLEPRLTVSNDSQVPMSSYHTIVLIHEDGQKELLTNFGDLFTITNMSYMK